MHPDLFLLHPGFERITRFVVQKEQRNVKKINLIVTGDADLLELKRKYFHEESFTDTISFNFNEAREAIEGEIYISIDRIRENAQTYETTFTKELVTVYIHSLLHLMGYEDDTAQHKKRMFALQNLYVHLQETTRLFRNHRKRSEA